MPPRKHLLSTLFLAVALALFPGALPPAAPAYAETGKPAYAETGKPAYAETGGLVKYQAAAAQSAIPYTCGYTQDTADLLSQVSSNSWAAWIRALSGVDSISVGGEIKTIITRSTIAMFDGDSPTHPTAYEYVKETISAWYPGQVSEDPFTFTYYSTVYPGKNLILDIPGGSLADEVVLLTAHLDSVNRYDTSSSDPDLFPAPGADDNATGAAALLETARILQGRSLARSLRLIWFTGEEQGLRGSHAYAVEYDLSNVVGVINLDMYGYDADNDGCFEIHAGTLDDSNRIGQCMAQVIDEYQIDLTYDYLTTSATNRSDHASFWSVDVGAVQILENFFDNHQAGGCAGQDDNPNYHMATDTIDAVNLQTGAAITHAALATLFSMAAEPELYPLYLPDLLNVYEE